MQKPPGNRSRYFVCNLSRAFLAVNNDDDDDDDDNNNNNNNIHVAS